ncbi:polymerase [Ralstonia sp. A12]|uniref:PglL family O-oligosaccharyltransferase n=1 Tax=Ralstonia sp. A12 TaxID=1217052 RepID=UPI000573BBD0|nr:Wzy polymerase domain-containing protein [Ralstonia sp. A12]KHK49292.1 polymerase [Ralstonia sp. A12]
MLRSRVVLIPLWLVVAICGAFPYLMAWHTYPLPTFYAEFGAGVCWAALAVAVLALTWGSKTGLPRIALAPLALILVLFLQLQLAPPLNPFLSLAATVYLLAAAVVCGLGARSRELPGVLEAFAIGVIVGGLATVAVELLHLFHVPNLSPGFFYSFEPTGTSRRMWGNMNQPNHVASYLAFGLAACVLLESKCRRVRLLLGVIALAFLFGMSLTFSRITWLHITVIGGLSGLAWTADQRGWRRWMMACTPIVALAIVYQLCNWLVAYANVIWHLDLPSSLGERMEQGAGLRPLLWKHAWHMFIAHPWLGGGWGDYAWNQFLQTDTLGHVEMSMNAHNILLDQLAKVGLAGLLAIALPCLGFMWSLRKRQVTPTLVFPLAIIFVMGVHSMAEYPLHYVFFLLPVAFALGFVDERNMRVPSASMTWTSSAILSVGATTLLAHLWGDYKAIERLQYSAEGWPKELARYQEHGQTLLLPYEHLAMAIHWRVTPEMAASLEKLELQAVQFYPGPGTVGPYALALAYLGKTDDAVLQIRRLRDQYWTDYAVQSRPIAQTCKQKKNEALKVFCARLQSENLLVGDDASSGENSPSASQ